jgi:hypothetical protein
LAKISANVNIRPAHLPWTIPLLWLICIAFYDGFCSSCPRDSVRLRVQPAERAEEMAAGQGRRVQRNL